MRRVWKTLMAALAVFVLAVGVAACGGGDSSSSSTAESRPQAQAESKPSEATPKQEESKGGGEGKTASKDEGQPEGGRKKASEFVPKQHSDSGGGSAQFKVKGGDNSVQEYGEEADSSEFEAAATTLHGFLDARAQSNWAATCEYMSKSVIESLEKLAGKAKQPSFDSCAAILEKLTNPAAIGAIKSEAENADVRSLRIEGEGGFALYTAKGTVYSMPMVNEGGSWKVTSLTGYPLS